VRDVARQPATARDAHEETRLVGRARARSEHRVPPLPRARISRGRTILHSRPPGPMTEPGHRTTTDNVDDDHDGDPEKTCTLRSTPLARLTARRTKHVHGRECEDGLSVHLPQQGPIAADMGEFTIFGPKIVGASTKAVCFDNGGRPHSEPARHAPARHLAVAARLTFPFLERPTRDGRGRTQSFLNDNTLVFAFF